MSIAEQLRKELEKYIFSWKTEPNYYSNCCDYPLSNWPDSDICPQCKEHCVPDPEMTKERFNNYWEEHWDEEGR
jgi:hypothetical protein